MKRKWNKAHRMWRGHVLSRDGGCVVCPAHKRKLHYCNVHHLIPHEFHLYEYDIDNGISLCPYHHALGKFSAHKHPLWFYLWMLANRPTQLKTALDRLRPVEHETR